MGMLKAIVIDVGWGDSIILESQNNNGDTYFALIDSNDTTYLRSSYVFLKRYFEKKNIDVTNIKPVFEYVFLSHGHSDHGKGLKRILREFGAQRFLYPKSTNWSSMSHLIKYCNRSSNVLHHQSIDSSKVLPQLGGANVNILWPTHNYINLDNENNNSLVLSFELNNISFLFSGDAEDEVWDSISNNIPPNTHFFKVPHHGSINGSLDQNGGPSWLDDCPQNAYLGISSHIRPHNHPHQQVIDLFNQNNREFFRTDEHYHLTFETDGIDTTVQYSHV